MDPIRLSRPEQIPMQHFSNTQWVNLPAFLLFVQLVLCTLYCRLFVKYLLLFIHTILFVQPRSIRHVRIRPRLGSRCRQERGVIQPPIRHDRSWTRSEDEHMMIDNIYQMSQDARTCSRYVAPQRYVYWMEMSQWWWHYSVFKRDPVRLLCGMNGVLQISKLISADHPRTYSLENKPAANWTYPIITRGYETTSLRASKNI